MTGIATVTWHVTPIAPPQPHRHCKTCGRARPFRPSGKVRLNANGRQLDAWLIYKCDTCDQTWNLPLLDRVAVAAVDPDDLWAMQVSDPAWVSARTFDLALLRRHCDRIDLQPDLHVTKVIALPAPMIWSEIGLTIVAPLPTGMRLDRLLAHELGLSRTRLVAMQASGGLCAAEGSLISLKTPVIGCLRLRFVAARLDDGTRAALSAALLTPETGPEP